MNESEMMANAPEPENSVSFSNVTCSVDRFGQIIGSGWNCKNPSMLANGTGALDKLRPVVVLVSVIVTPAIKSFARVVASGTGGLLGSGANAKTANFSQKKSLSPCVLKSNVAIDAGGDEKMARLKLSD